MIPLILAAALMGGHPKVRGDLDQFYASKEAVVHFRGGEGVRATKLVEGAGLRVVRHPAGEDCLIVRLKGQFKKEAGEALDRIASSEQIREVVIKR